MANQKRNSTVAFKVESTEGVPNLPDAAGDFVELQDDFTVGFDQETLENATLRGSLAPAEPIQGVENPSLSFSHYLKHGGTEGAAPQLDEVLTAGFGAEQIQATERDTVASTTTSLTVDSGEGTEFRAGGAVLVKHGAFLYEIMPIHSISGDVLTTAFALQNAAANGTNLGKQVVYYPANSGQQTLTAQLWHGTSGIVSLMAGLRPTNFAISATAGQLINMSMSFSGLSHFFNPIEIEASDIYLDFTDDQGTAAAIITAKVYKNPHDLADALTTAMNAVTTETHAVTYSNTTGKFTVSTSTSAVLSLLWNTGTNTANTVGDKLGFSTAADDTGATSYVSDNAINLAKPATPVYDSTGPLVSKNNRLMIGTQLQNACIAANDVQVNIDLTVVFQDSVCAESGRAFSVVDARVASMTVQSLLDQYHAQFFDQFSNNETVRVSWSFGNKSGGNWVAGQSGNLYLPNAKITSFTPDDNNGIITSTIEIAAFKDGSSTLEDVYLTFL